MIQRPIIKYVNKDSESCAHKNCTQCYGTGLKENGSMCIHYISCPCKRCSPTYL